MSVQTRRTATHRSAGAVVALLLSLSAAALPCHAQGPDLERAKSVAAEFLGTTVGETVWLSVRPRDGVPNWYNALVVHVPDPPTSATAGGGGIRLYIDPRGYYVCRTQWSQRFPTEGLTEAEALSLGETRAIAEAFVAGHFPGWSERMRLKSEWAGSTSRKPVIFAHEFWWEEWLDGVRTGSYVRCGVSPRPPGTIYSYAAYIAPKWSPDVVKVTREEAEQTALKLLEERGAEKPWVLKADLFLSKPFMEQPHWFVGMDYANRDGGFLEQLLIDAVTGEELKPQFGYSGSR